MNTTFRLLTLIALSLILSGCSTMKTRPTAMVQGMSRQFHLEEEVKVRSGASVFTLNRGSYRLFSTDAAGDYFINEEAGVTWTALGIPERWRGGLFVSRDLSGPVGVWRLPREGTIASTGYALEYIKSGAKEGDVLYDRDIPEPERSKLRRLVEGAK